MTVRHDSRYAGFGDPVLDSQRTVRLLMDAVSQPGTIVILPPEVRVPSIEGVDAMTVALLLALTDRDTPTTLDPALASTALASVITFQNGTPFSEATSAMFAATATPGAGHHLLARLPAGTVERPEDSATLIVSIDAWDAGPAVELRGPGIDGVARLAPAGPDPSFWDAVIESRADYPIGIDLVLVHHRAAVGLPRSTRLRFLGT